MGKGWLGGWGVSSCRGPLVFWGAHPKFPPAPLLILAVGCRGTEPDPVGIPSPQALLKTGEHSWSLAELVQALVLLTHYHSLASFVFGCGINPEAEQDGGHGARPPSPHGDSSLASEDSMGCSGVRRGGPCMERGFPVGRWVSPGAVTVPRAAPSLCKVLGGGTLCLGFKQH